MSIQTILYTLILFLLIVHIIQRIQYKNTINNFHNRLIEGLEGIEKSLDKTIKNIS
jgi:hypothetical protein